MKIKTLKYWTMAHLPAQRHIWISFQAYFPLHSPLILYLVNIFLFPPFLCSSSISLSLLQTSFLISSFSSQCRLPVCPCFVHALPRPWPPVSSNCYKPCINGRKRVREGRMEREKEIWIMERREGRRERGKERERERERETEGEEVKERECEREGGRDVEEERREWRLQCVRSITHQCCAKLALVRATCCDYSHTHTHAHTHTHTHTHSNLYIRPICSDVFLLTYRVRIIQPRHSLYWAGTHTCRHLNKLFCPFTCVHRHPKTCRKWYLNCESIDKNTQSCGIQVSHQTVQVSEALSIWVDPC